MQIYYFLLDKCPFIWDKMVKFAYKNMKCVIATIMNI
jgi:hypothetical protein